MKKALSVTLALILCVCLCSTAFAATNPTFTQTWTKTWGNGINISENVPMVVTEDPSNPVSGTTLELSRNNTTGVVTITCPTYTTAGIYKYSITQTPGNSQGATYDAGTIGFEVLVSYNNNGSVYVEKTGLSKVDGAKKDAFENYFKFGALTITNHIAGNLGDTSAKLPITVTLHADKTVTTQISYNVDGGSDIALSGGSWTGDRVVEISGVSNNGSVHFNNVPEGVTYTISEAGTNGYTVSASPASGTIAAEQDSAVSVTQTKEADINTGINLDSIPFLVLLAVVVLGAALLFLRRRRREQD